MIWLSADRRLYSNGAPCSVSRLNQDLARAVAASKGQDGSDLPALGEECKFLICNLGRNLHCASRSIQANYGVGFSTVEVSLTVFHREWLTTLKGAESKLFPEVHDAFGNAKDAVNRPIVGARF
jgi:hypothetical protein